MRYAILAMSAIFVFSPKAFSADKGVSEKTSASPVYTYKIVNIYPHDSGAFTQGLVFNKGFLYESTGLYGRSSLRKAKLDTGEVLQITRLDDKFFGEGLTIYNGRLIQLTWRSHRGFVYDLETFKLLKEFNYPRQGWGITNDGQYLILSDGTPWLYYLNPDSFRETRRIYAHDENGPVDFLNELEYINGEIYANIWQDNRIARISPKDGRVLAWIDLSGIIDLQNYAAKPDILNGIAYDALGRRLFVTGKFWPNIFEVEAIERQSK